MQHIHTQLWYFYTKVQSSFVKKRCKLLLFPIKMDSICTNRKNKYVLFQLSCVKLIHQ